MRRQAMRVINCFDFKDKTPFGLTDFQDFIAGIKSQNAFRLCFSPVLGSCGVKLKASDVTVQYVFKYETAAFPILFSMFNCAFVKSSLRALKT